MLFRSSNHNGTLSLRYSSIQDCGADGLSHGCYIGGWSLFDVLGCTFKSTSQAKPQNAVGHFLKSRARTTRVRGSRFDGAYGCARLMDISNGGSFECTGNVLLHYGPPVYGDDNFPIAFGAEQNPSTRTPPAGNTVNFVDDGRTHSIYVAQNTMRKSQPAGGTPFEFVHLYPVYDNTDRVMSVARNVRSNIVAGPAASGFTSTYAGNVEAAITRVGNDGLVSSGPYAGTTADAAYEYRDEMLAPVARSDTRMGARSALPTWVPSATWTFTDIPGTRFSDYMKNDGTGIAPAQSEELPNHGSPSYLRQWDYSGGAYSPKNRELYMFGGGHNATSINALSRWNLGKNTPDMTLVSAPTSIAIRKAEYANTPQYNTSGYWSDGRPRSPHGYRNLQVLDSIDEVVCVTLSAGDHPTLDAYSWNVTAGFPRGGSAWRPNGYWPGVPDDPGQSLGIEMLTFPSYDQSAVYFTRGGGPLRRLDGATRAITQIGTSAVNWSYTARGAARPDSSIALIVGGNESTTGWRARFIDLTTGVQTPAVVSGYAWPAGLEYHDMVWVPVIEKFVALLYNRSYLDDQVVRDVRLITLQPTGGANLVAALVPVAGAAPTTSGGWVRGLYWDPALSVLILGNGPTNPLKAIRVA